MKKKILSLVLGAVAATTLFATAPAIAETAPVAASTQGTEVGVQADGNFYAYYRLNRTQQCGAWAGNALDMGSCGLGAESVWNNGFPGARDDVFVHQGTRCGGERRGIYNGVWLDDLRQWNFDGTVTALWHNLRSFCWVQLP